MKLTCSAWPEDRKDLLLLAGLTVLCYADKILLGPYAVVDFYDSLEIHFTHFRSMWELWARYGLFSWYPFNAGGAPSFVGQHAPYHPAVLLSGLLPMWLLSLAWNMGQMFLAGYGMYRFLPLLLNVSRRNALLCSALFSLFWVSGNVHFVMSYAFPAVFVWTTELFSCQTPRGKRLGRALMLVIAMLFTFPVLALPHFPVLHLVLVLFLGRHLPDFRWQVAGVFLVWTAFVLIHLPTIASLFLYIPYAQREWSFPYSGHAAALLDFLRWLRGRLGDQYALSALLLGLPLLPRRRELRVCYALLLASLLIAGVFTSELKGLFAGSFLLKMDLFMFANCLGILGLLVVSATIDLAADWIQPWPRFWPVIVAVLLSLFGSANKTLTHLAILGVVLAGGLLMRAPSPGEEPSSRRKHAAVALAICLALVAMFIRQQNMAAGVFVPYAQGFLGHDVLTDLGGTKYATPFRVADIDVHPVIAQAHGLDTVDQKGPLFNKYYKEFVREAIRPQFTKPGQEEAFNALWRQLYLTRVRSDHDQRSFDLPGAPQRSISDLNWNILRAMNVTHVLSTSEIAGLAPEHASTHFLPSQEPGPFSPGRLLPGNLVSMSLWLYELKDPLPRVYLADPVTLETREGVLHALCAADLDTLRSKTFLAREDMPPTLQSVTAGMPVSGSPGAVSILSWAPDRIVVEGRADRPCILVALNNQDPNWNAEFPSGKSVAAFRANHAFQGYLIDAAGPFRLELRYRTPLVWWLHFGSAAGLGLIFVGVLRRREASSSEGCKHPEAPSAVISLPGMLYWGLGLGAGLVWGVAFFLFVMKKGKPPQAASFPYALWSISAMGVMVSVWTGRLLRRL